MYFAASYDGLTKGITAALVLLVAGVAIVTQSLVAAGLGVLIVLGGYAFSPRGYYCGNGCVRVERLIGNVLEPLADVRDVRHATAADLKGALRLWGSGGLFGYYGLFRTSALGKCTWYTTRRDRMVVVITGTRRTLYSPDDARGFVDAVRTMAPVAAGAPPMPPMAKSRTGLWVGLGVVVFLGLIFAALFYNPGPPRYTLTADSLTIHDPCFYSVTVKKGEIDLTAARVVDFATERDWRPAARTNGFANAYYASGWFRASNGQKMRMYRARGTRLVLLPPKGDGAPILYQAADPQAFIDELRRAW